MSRRLPRGVVPETPGPGQESVWDYPRPPRLERTDHHLRVWLAGELIADTREAYRVLETSHPPVYYFPPDSLAPDTLWTTEATSFCEFKGTAVYHDVRGGGAVASRSAWSYPDPVPAFAAIRDHVAFYVHPMDRCEVDGETARPQPGRFYGGWVTSHVVGPFKGVPGSQGW